MPATVRKAVVLWAFVLPVWLCGVGRGTQAAAVAKRLTAVTAQTQQHLPAHTPPGLPPCMHLFVPQGQLPSAVGESLRYTIQVGQVAVGTIDFKINQRGRHHDEPVLEYRSLFTLDALAAFLMPATGRAASLVAPTAFWPRMAMTHYTLNGQVIDETMTFEPAGMDFVAKTLAQGKTTLTPRSLPTATVDFVCGFYMLRRVPLQQSSCAVIYGNRRAYTVWMEPTEQEWVKTPGGSRLAQRLEVRFASERAKVITQGALWLGLDDDRLPIKAEVRGEHPIEARLHRFERGEKTASSALPSAEGAPRQDKPGAF